MSDLDTQITDRAIEIVRQLAHVAVERGELAKLLGFELEATTERELGRRLHQLAGQARHVFELCDRDREQTLMAEAKAAAEEELASEAPAPVAATPWTAWGNPQPDPWPSRPSKPMLPVWETVDRLTTSQRSGTACFICGYNFAAEPGRPSAVLVGYQLSIHNDPAVCTRILTERLDKEVPF